MGGPWVTDRGFAQIVNSGNAVANATLAANNAAFTLSAKAATVPGSGASPIAATFAPGSSTEAQAGTVALAVGTTDVLCGPLPAPLAVSGTGTNGSVGFNPGSLAFGLIDCGGQASPQQVVFANAGNQAYTIAASLDGGSAYAIALSPAGGVVAPDGGTATITVTPSAIPAASAVPGSYGDTLTVTTSVADAGPYEIPLTEGAEGAILSLSTNSFAFPSTSVGAESTIQYGITNSGNLPATTQVAGAANSVFSFDQGGVASANSETMAKAYFEPTAAQTYSETATFGVAAGTVLCAPLPDAAFKLSGTGNNTSTATVSPTSVDYGLVDCGSSASPKTLTISNLGTNSFTWTSSWAKGANFSIDPTSGTVPAGSTESVTLTPVAIPVSASTTTAYNAYGDTLTITTSATNDSPHSIAITETAQGAILTFSPSSVSVAFGSSPANFTVQNGGNLTASLTLTLDNPNNLPITESPTGGSSAQNAPLGGVITDTGANGSTHHSATVSVTTSSAICTPLPADLQVSVGTP